jgi:hypothetical protein
MCNFDGTAFGAYFRRHPKIHFTLHSVLWVVSGLELLQPKLLGASALFPEGSAIPKYIAYGLATIAFSNIFIGKAAEFTDPAAPAVPASEAVTKVEKVNPEKSA